MVLQGTDGIISVIHADNLFIAFMKDHIHHECFICGRYLKYAFPMT